MEKSSVNRIDTGNEYGGAAFSKSGDEMPCLHPFEVAANFFHFVQWVAQGRSKILPCWCRMKQLSANRFSTGGANWVNYCQNTTMPGCPRLNKLFSPVDSSGHCGRQFPHIFCACGAPSPVRLRAGFQFGGPFNNRDKSTLFHFGTEPFKNQLKSVPCLRP